MAFYHELKVDILEENLRPERLVEWRLGVIEWHTPSIFHTIDVNYKEHPHFIEYLSNPKAYSFTTSLPEPNLLKEIRFYRRCYVYRPTILSAGVANQLSNCKETLVFNPDFDNYKILEWFVKSGLDFGPTLVLSIK